jgi:transcriptional regulator with XRE-family HTH domain
MEETELKVFIKKIGTRIKELRLERKMTQLDLAVASNIDERQIQRLEASHTSPTIKTLFKVAKGLNVEIGMFFDFSEASNV